jgi:hypothetical protein
LAAFPFGGHPTLDEYVAWAREHGCKSSSGILSDEDGRVHSLTRIVSRAGNWVTVTGLKGTDRLVPTMIGYLDRRLGMRSPWFSVDDPDLDPSRE